jgi:lysophospholipase L1-like esterase
VTPPFRLNRLRRLCVLAAVIAFQFLAFEAGLRLWGSSEAAPSFQTLFLRDPDIGFRLRPGARIRFTTPEFDTQIGVNNVGIRDDEDLKPKALEERRIVVLGDSLVLSVQVPQSAAFTEVLERRLNGRSSSEPYRVLNAGVQGYGPVQELLWFKKLGATLEPDLVIVTIFVGNDAEEAYASRTALSASGHSSADRLRDTLTTNLRRFVRQSMVLQIIRTRVAAVTGRVQFRSTVPEPPHQSYAANPSPWVDDGFAIAINCVSEIAAHARSLGAQTAVLLMPARFQVVDTDYDRIRRVVADSGGELVRDAATARFADALADLDLPWLDLLPALRSAEPRTGLFFERNIHLTPRGHEVVAAAIETFLDEQGLVGHSGPDRDR